jgi:hypothetical protein
MAIVNYGVQSPDLTLDVQMELSDADSARVVEYLMVATPYGTVTENVQKEVPNPAWSPDQEDPSDPPEYILVQEWVKKLSQIEGWVWDLQDAKWTQNLNELRGFASKHGHCRISKSANSTKELASWIQNQRRRYRLGNLSKEEVSSLEAVQGWTWDPIAEQWDAHLDALRVYQSRTGTVLMPRGHREGGLGLAQWTQTQRSAYKARKLSRDRIKRLENVPGWTWRAPIGLASTRQRDSSTRDRRTKSVPKGRKNQ